MMDEDERKSNLSNINRLDETGISLTAELANVLGDDYTLRYYSEGLLDYTE